MKQARSDTGFSLVEMMMVVAIIGLMTSAVVLVMPAKDSGLRDTLMGAERAFIALSRHSVMTGRVYGARFSVGGFEVLSLTDNGWAPVTGLLKPEVTIWQPASLVSLKIGGSDMGPIEDTASPHIWFLPTSETTEFEVKLSTASQTGMLKIDAAGKTRVELDD